jgi:hypothetical protein
MINMPVYLDGITRIFKDIRIQTEQNKKLSINIWSGSGDGEGGDVWLNCP